MKIQPACDYKPRPMPMQHELTSGYPIENLSSNRWQRAARLAGGCAALQWMLGCSAEADKTAPPAPSTLSPEQDRPRDEKPITQTAPQVIPLLEEALANDGRGAFGCDAINPPAFLSEDDALDLIRKEFAKAGLKLDSQTPIVADVAKPMTTTMAEPKVDKNGEYMRDAAGNYIYEPLSFHPREPFQFDLAFNDQKIRIEYIGLTDYDEWQKEMSAWSVSEYNLADTARRLRDSLVAQDDLEPGVYGIFFDPMKAPNSWHQYPKTENMTKDNQELAWEKFQRELETATKASGQAALQKQIDYFLAALKEEGLIETPAP